MITASLTAALALTLGAIGAFPDDSQSNAVAGVKLTFVDLQWIGNQKLSEKIGDLDGNDLAAVPKGPQSSPAPGTKSVSGSSACAASNLRWPLAKSPGCCGWRALNRGDPDALSAPPSRIDYTAAFNAGAAVERYEYSDGAHVDAWYDTVQPRAA